MSVHLYLFGDGSDDFIPELDHTLRMVGEEPYLKRFLTHSASVLRTEVGRLPPQERRRFQRFYSLQDLISPLHVGHLHPALRSALVCVTHLSSYIRLSTRRKIWADARSDVFALGFGLGALSAAAVSSSEDLSQLVAVSLLTVRLAFQTALRARYTVEAIDTTDGLSQPAYALKISEWPASQARLAIESFNRQKHEHLRRSDLFISFESDSHVVVGGNPTVLAEFCNSSLCKGKIVRHITDFPCHNPLLLGDEVIESVLEATEQTQWPQFQRHLPVLSAATGQFSLLSDFGSQVREALSDLLRRPVSWTDVVRGVSCLGGMKVGTRLVVSEFGAGFGQNLGRDLSAAGLLVDLQTVRSGHLFADSKASTTPESLGNAAGKEKIAIVGISGRFPEAEDLTSFWSLLSQGLDVHKVTPSTRWNVDTHVDPTLKRKNTSKTPFGCWLNNPGHFDANFFGMSPRETAQVDPASRLALMTAYEAMEQAGMVPDSTPSTMKDRVGVLYGVTSNDWMEVNSAQNIDTFFIPGGCRAFIPGRVNYFFKFSGLSSSIDTACSSSLSAVHAACNALWQEDIDTAIVGGTNVLTNPDYTAGLSRGHFLSPTGNCKSFDNDADGYCRGEGVCTVVLKRLSDAIADNDPIQGLILGAYTNHSAEAESITRPQMQAQRDIFGKILGDASVHPFDVSYVEMHGTGTQAGDPCEMTSVANVFSPTDVSVSRPADKPLHVGSAKANVGHGEAAAGVTSLAKVLLMMRNNTIPPHCGIKTKMNERFPADLDKRQIFVARESKPWLRRSDNKTRKAFINNFSAAGGNSSLLIEEPPMPTKKPSSVLPSSFVVATSAKSSASLQANIGALLSHLRQNKDNVDLASLSYTTTARRLHHPFRAVAHGSSVADIISQFQELEAKTHEKPRRKPTAGFVFVGNGSQYPGMGRQLWDAFPTFRRTLRLFEAIAQVQGLPSILKFCAADRTLPAEDDIVSSHVALVCFEIAKARLFMSWGISPKYVFGHSIGEYAALNIAGVLSDYDTLYIVAKRAQLIAQNCEKNTHGMLAVRTSRENVKALLATQEHEVVCANSRDDVTLGASLEQMPKICKILQRHSIKHARLGVPYAFHSSQMDLVVNDFLAAIQNVQFKKPTIPVISPLLSSVIATDGVFSAGYLAKHLRLPVNLTDAVAAAQSQGLISDSSTIVEIGPQSTVARSIQLDLNPSVLVVPAKRKDGDVWPALTAALSRLYIQGHDIEWREFYSSFQASLSVLELPHYRWNLKDYWIQYVNDWSLRKGDPVPDIRGISMIEADRKPKPELKDQIIQRVLKDEESTSGISIVAELDLLHPDIHPSARGHKVNGISLVTPSFYADIALRLGRYISKRYRTDLEDMLPSITPMVIESALTIPENDRTRVLTFSANLKTQSLSVDLEFYTLDPFTQEKTRHSTCGIAFVERAKTNLAMQEKAKSAQDGVRRLLQESQDGESFRFNNSMIYKMVSSLAQFESKYRQVNEIIMNSTTMDASSTVTFEKEPVGVEFSPAIDALSQSAGFVMNANENADLDKTVFINHGWSRFHLVKTLSAKTKYTTHVQLRQTAETQWEGDLVVLEGAAVVAYFEKIALQRVPRRLLGFILSKASKSSTASTGLPAAVTVVEEPIPRPAEPVSKRLPPTPPPSRPSPEDMDEIPSEIVRKLSTVIASPIATLSSHLPISPKADSTYSSVADLDRTAASETFDKVLQIMVEETGIELDEFTDEAKFTDLGIDSLLTLMINARLSEELNLDYGNSMYTTYPSVKDLRDHIVGVSNNSKEDALVNVVELTVGDLTQCSTPYMGSALAPNTVTVELSDIPLLPAKVAAYERVKSTPCPAATSVVLQGRSNSEMDILFLFPDGAGSAASYADIGRISPNLSVVGLNCPLLKEPERLRSVMLDDLIASYLTEIRRRRPYGPYHLGGWSSGGILAYRAAQQLIREGEDVLTLSLIDAPSPVAGLDHLPRRWYDHCAAANLFGKLPGGGGGASGKKLPHDQQQQREKTIEHFEASIDVLHDYHAEPIPEGFAPRVSIAWASECVFDGVQFPKFQVFPGDGEGVKFLAEKRTDLTAGQWGDLFPGQDCSVDMIEGADHFSMMRKEFGARLAGFLKQATL